MSKRSKHLEQAMDCWDRVLTMSDQIGNLKATHDDWMAEIPQGRPPTHYEINTAIRNAACLIDNFNSIICTLTSCSNELEKAFDS